MRLVPVQAAADFDLQRHRKLRRARHAQADLKLRVAQQLTDSGVPTKVSAIEKRLADKQYNQLQPIPIAPAAHYHMGGIAVDARGRTSLKGLWAGGEVSCTGAHGANRLASNSLLEAVVYAARIAEDIGGQSLAYPARPSISATIPRSCAMPPFTE